MFSDYITARTKQLGLRPVDVHRGIPNVKTGELVKYPSVRAWFKGPSTPTHDKLKYLAIVLQTTVAELEAEIEKDAAEKAKKGKLPKKEHDPEVILLRAELARIQKKLDGLS